MVTATPRAVIWARSAGRCQYSGCNRSLIGDLLSGNDDANFGLIAHIVAEKPTGPRGDPVRSSQLADDPSNLMLMCYTHHKLIDHDEREGHPEQLLLEMKAAHEERNHIVTEIRPERASHVLRYGARIGLNESPISYDRVAIAMLPERYPADGRSIGIEIRGSIIDDGEEKFWAVEPDNLRRQFQTLVSSRIAEREITHLSVFALAPMPLLIELGRLLGDIAPSEVYQLHREPAGWRWANNGPRIEYRVSRPSITTGPVALKLGLSASITDDRIISVIGPEASIWSLTAANPGNDVMRYPSDLAEFRRLMRSLYHDIKVVHGPDAIINLFPAIPVSAAVEVGRVWMPKADLSLIIYDETRGKGFLPRLKIG
jgi:hypothetical protein